MRWLRVMIYTLISIGCKISIKMTSPLLSTFGRVRFFFLVPRTTPVNREHRRPQRILSTVAVVADWYCYIPRKTMLLASKLGSNRRFLFTDYINRACQVTASFTTSISLNLQSMRNHISDSIVRNSYIRTILFDTGQACGDSGLNGLESKSWYPRVNMKRLDNVVVRLCHDVSELDCSALFPLPLTRAHRCKNLKSTSRTAITGCVDDVMSAMSALSCYGPWCCFPKIIYICLEQLIRSCRYCPVRRRRLKHSAKVYSELKTTFRRIFQSPDKLLNLLHG
jgi:hypothetical protein